MQSRLGYKPFADIAMFKLIFPGVLMTVTLVERALLVKLLYENKDNASDAVRDFL